MQADRRRGVVSRTSAGGSVRELKAQFVNAFLVILTTAAVICAGINFQQQKRFQLPEDGAIWVDQGGAVLALDVRPDSPAERAGLRTGDVLLRIEKQRVENASDVAKTLVTLSSWNKAEYVVRRSGVEVKATVIIGERTTDPAVYYQYAVGIAWLGIGLFVYFRRGNAPKSLHFYLLCLASFVLSSFHYTGKLNNFDKVIYWGNVAAGLLAPTIFLHFCLTFPETRRLRKPLVMLLYLPALSILTVYLGLASGRLRVDAPLFQIRWMLDQGWLVFFSACYLAGGLLLHREYRRAEAGVVRQQLKWLRNGAVLGIVPFTAFYVIPYLLGAIPGAYMNMAVFSLPLLPLTWAYAILRYRLMDVDVIFQQGYVYTLATLAVLAVFFGLVFSIGKLDDISPSAAAILIVIAAFIFQPIRAWIQEQLDRYYFYKDRYDYRRTLIEFARELGSETDRHRMLSSVADRLLRTLSIQHLAVFVLDEEQGGFRLALAAGSRDRSGHPFQPAPELDLRFLPEKPETPYLFIERTRYPLDVLSRDLPPSVRHTIAELGLTYYVPCTVRGRTIAYLGVSRTEKGDFLASDDLELLQTMAGYVGIAIENARLYGSLQRKVDEYERLKEFSENIVESINVGILAAALDDRVESWNSRMESLTGITRDDAVGRRLCELFPPALCEEFDRVRNETGIHHLYKFVLPAGSGSRGANGNGRLPREDVTVNMAIAPLVSKDLQQIGRLIIFDDVTERTELERRLMQADKLSSIGLLAAGVAHEVNTPLAVISTYAQMLAKQISEDETKSKLLEKIAKQTFRASEIVNSLLNFSRTSTTEFDEVDLNRVIRETATLIGHQLEKVGVQTELQLAESLPAVRGNSGKLQQVFLNLFLNARDAMEGGGVLRVRSWSEDGLVRIDVLDTGQGIAPEHLERIYDPFFTTKGSRKGTGLGLSVTYGIVKEHGGAIAVDSKPGSGTRFHLDFPLSRKAVNV